jgi:CubicO group peptidase (beta-lactamase class C family)
LIRKRKILLAAILIALMGLDPGAMENNGSSTDKLIPSNVRLINAVSSYEEFAGFERVINSFINRWEIAGASVAVAKDGKLIYAHGFGYSNRESGELVEPYNKFRIASISKLVTAVAVMKLQEEGKLSVHSRVFGPDGILNDSIFSSPKDKRVFGITVGHLLSHSGGWTTRWGDQMFMPMVVAEKMGVKPPADIKTIIRFALDKNLHFTPGSGTSYSNLGYAILGLVVERASGMPYSDYCRNNVLAPLGIHDMLIGKNTDSVKLPYEVKYYEPLGAPLKPSIYNPDIQVPSSNGGNDIEALGGAGAWVATAPDLMRLLLAIDGFQSRPDFLSSESIDFMTDTKNGYAPVGWRTTLVDGTWWRTGTFPGTACMMKRQPDGTSWVVLLNSSAWNGPEISADINYMMARALAHVKRFPEKDLFEYSVPIPLLDDIKH